MPLHPFIVQLLEQLADRPAISAGSPQDARDLIAAGREVLGPGPEMHETRDFALPTRAGAIPARLHIPRAEPAGLVVVLHGGGWVIGNIDDYDTLGRQFAAESGCAVLLPDYRLAPEHPFPAPLEDAEDALLWAAEEAKRGFARPLALAAAGDSAGGNLVTVAARRLRGRVDLALQSLIYPVTDCDVSRPSYAAHGEGLPLTARDMAWFFDHYSDAGTRATPDIAPLRAPDLAGLPPAVVSLAEYDILHDEGLAYAEALEASGVPVTLRRADGMTHGYIRMHNLCEPIAAEVTRLGRELGEACAAAAPQRA
ncbi:MAG: alpha/beta hydrolase [Pseudomonadota bacterium]